jgi:hypothetical protein
VTGTTTADAVVTQATSLSLVQKQYGWVVPFLLGVGVLLAMLVSLCIGAYPMSFGQAARIVMHLAWPGPLPATPRGR